jgi:hypothetical protein
LAAFAAEKPWLMQALDAEMAVRDDSLRSEWTFLPKLAHQGQRGGLVARAGASKTRRRRRSRDATWQLDEVNLKSMGGWFICRNSKVGLAN